MQVFPTIDAAIDKFKRSPIPPDAQQAAPSHHQATYQQYPAAGSRAAPVAYQDPHTSYPAAAGTQYAGTAYDASAYPSGQYGAYPQQQYQQPYAAPAAAAAPQGELLFAVGPCLL